MDMKLPKLPPLHRHLRAPMAERILPAAAALGLVAAGVRLWRWRPSLLDLPEPAPLQGGRPRGLFRRAARRSREGVSLVAPGNLGVSLGRSLVIAGTALLAARVLDELSDPRD
jgi:hypothetical protein